MRDDHYIRAQRDLRERDSVWVALGRLRDSDTVREARAFAAGIETARARRRRLWTSLFAVPWPRFAVGAAAVAAAIAFIPSWNAGVVETDVGEIRRATLADGSVVMLNTDTELRVDFADNERRVTLVSGQARFDVAHDASRPFRVAAGAVTVTAVGTAFDVVALPRRTAVTLIEGKVVVEARAAGTGVRPSRAVLAPGDQVTLDGGRLAARRPPRLDAALAWQRSLVDLNSMTLTQALDEVNRYSETKVVVADPTLAREQVSGVFKAGDVEAVATALQAYFGLEVVRRNEREIVLDRPV